MKKIYLALILLATCTVNIFSMQTSKDKEFAIAKQKIALVRKEINDNAYKTTKTSIRDFLYRSAMGTLDKASAVKAFLEAHSDIKDKSDITQFKTYAENVYVDGISCYETSLFTSEENIFVDSVLKKLNAIDPIIESKPIPNSLLMEDVSVRRRNPKPGVFLILIIIAACLYYKFHKKLPKKKQSEKSK